MSETEHERRERLKCETAEDLRKPIHQLLTDIHEESVSGDENTGVPLQRELARFASLLGVLANQSAAQSEQAAEQSNANLTVQTSMLKITRYVLLLSLALGMISVAQVILSYLQLKATKVAHSETQRNQDHKAGQSKQSLESPVQSPTQP